MNIGKLIGRVKSILLSPTSEWPVIAAEPATTKGLYINYFMILAAIPALFGFIKDSLIGHSLFGVTVTTPILAGIVGMIVAYVLSLVLLFVVALITSALAGSFGGRKDQLQALKLVGYAWTAAWVAGVAVIIPWVGWLLMLAGGAYSIYLLYLGLPHTMKCPRDKAIGYTAVIVIIAVVLSLIMAAVVAGVTGLGSMASAAIGGDDNIGQPQVTFDEDSQLGKLAALGERLQAAGEQAEAASDAAPIEASQDADAGGPDAGALAALAAMGQRMQANAEQAQQGQSAAAAETPQAQTQAAQQSMSAMMGAMFGGQDGKVSAAVSTDQLKSFLPESLAGLQRQSLSAERQAGMGMQITEASADYANDDGSLRVSVKLTDMPAAGGMLAMASAFGGGESETQTANGYEKTYTVDGHRVHEKWNENSHRGEYSIMIGDRFQVEAEGRVQGMDQLKGIVGSLDLMGLAALKDAGVQQQ